MHTTITEPIRPPRITTRQDPATGKAITIRRRPLNRKTAKRIMLAEQLGRRW